MIPTRFLVLVLLLVPSFALAHDGHAAAAPASASVDAEAEAALAVVDAFSAAIQAGDLPRAEALLEPGVQVLESGGAERSRAEYMQHHAGADAEFLKNASVRALRRTARADGGLAWVATESEIQSGGKTYLSAETMVLRRGPDGWRIAYIHWSSRPKAAE